MNARARLKLAADRGEDFVPPFGVVAGESPLLAAAEQHLAATAMQFIRAGMRSDGSGEADSFDGFESALNAHFVEALTGGGILLDMKWMKRLTGDRGPDDFALIAWRAYVKSHLEWCEKLHLCKALPAFAHRPDGDVAEQEVLRAGGLLATGAAENLSGLDLAWATVKSNLERAEFRTAAAYTLLGAVRGKKQNIPKTAGIQFDKLAKMLWSQRQTVMTQFFAVGTLIGDAARDEVKARAKSMFSETYGVMHLVERDGIAPSRWLCEDEKRLRDDISRA